MKALNKEAAEVFKKLLSMVDDRGYVKIDNSEGLFMPVSVEILDTQDSFLDVSVAHYFEQNGDLMADPEMCFMFDKTEDKVYPYYFKQDGHGIEAASGYIDGQSGMLVVLKPAHQYGQTNFADIWMSNIKEQQGL